MSYTFKTLNYLGSKLRLLDFIEEHVKEITPPGAGVCDLFAGTGCVSRKLSRLFPMVACDIQSYSQVICEALLNKFVVEDNDVDEFFHLIHGDFADKIREMYLPLIEIEQKAIKEKDLEMLTCILEHGSLEVFRIDPTHSLLTNELQLTNQRLAKSRLLDSSSLVSRYYGGVYFSYEQAVEIDILLDGIHRYIPKHNRSLFLAALLSTASCLAHTVGKHFAQPIKARDTQGNIKKLVYNKAVKDKTMDVESLFSDWLTRYSTLEKNSFHHTTIKADFAQSIMSLPESVCTIYADPPYTRDHYSRYYHVLETIVLRDSPHISTSTVRGAKHISNGIYRDDRHQSPFCIKSQATGAFLKLFELSATKNKNIVLSYSPYDESRKSHPRVVTMGQLISLARKYYSKVETVSAGEFKHNKLNSTEHLLEASDEAEMLIICSN